MADIKRLTQTHDLKTEFLKTFKDHPHQIFVKHDQTFDALLILLVPPDVETVVHYVDNRVGLLYRPTDLEIVGLQVEAFEHSFLPDHDTVRHVWRLSDTGDELEDFGDLVLAVERRQPEVAREVARAAEATLPESDQEFVRAIEYALA